VSIWSAQTIDVDRVCRGNVLGSRPGPGGEWDEVRSIPRRTRRRLIGAGMMSPRGMAPDVLADIVSDWFGRDMDSCETVRWYVRSCVLILDQRRVARDARTYRQRDRLAKDRGFISFYHQRRTRERQRRREQRRAA